MGVKIIGYSERGMINALCDDMERTPANLGTFLKWLRFPFVDQSQWPCFDESTDQATLLVEQSFSSSGDLDLLILLDSKASGLKHAVMVEAKVSNYTRSWLTILDRWEEFLRIIDQGDGDTSNLFVQLHRKVRLIDRLHNNDFVPDLLTGSSGSHPIVERAAQKLKEYSKDSIAWYVALVPDKDDDVEAFFCDQLVRHEVEQLPGWNTSHWGFVTWPRIDSSIDRTAWRRTADCFDWNQGQIYRLEPTVSQAVDSNAIYEVDGRIAYVVDSGRGGICRYAWVDSSNDFFWRTETSEVSRLIQSDRVLDAFIRPCLPASGSTYEWNPLNDPSWFPEKSANPVLDPGTRVLVKNSGWLTTRVTLEDQPNQPSFRVFTHHLKRN